MVAYFDLSQHGNQYGTYNFDVYVKDPAGRQGQRFYLRREYNVF